MEKEETKYRKKRKYNERELFLNYVGSPLMDRFGLDQTYPAENKLMYFNFDYKYTVGRSDILYWSSMGYGRHYRHYSTPFNPLYNPLTGLKSKLTLKSGTTKPERSTLNPWTNCCQTNQTSKTLVVGWDHPDYTEIHTEIIIIDSHSIEKLHDWLPCMEMTNSLLQYWIIKRCLSKELTRDSIKTIWSLILNLELDITWDETLNCSFVRTIISCVEHYWPIAETFSLLPFQNPMDGSFIIDGSDGYINRWEDAARLIDDLIVYGLTDYETVGRDLFPEIDPFYKPQRLYSRQRFNNAVVQFNERKNYLKTTLYDYFPRELIEMIREYTPSSFRK